jgi:general secretion pathway protein G
MTITLPQTRRTRATFAGRLHAASAFTLTEILIAIALIVAVVALAVTNLNVIFGNSQAQIAKLFVTQTIETPLLTYRMATGSYPSTDQGLAALIHAPDGVSGWSGPYLNEDKIPTDPWGHPYQYAFPGTHNPTKYDCWSYGPTGSSNATDIIGNWSTN